MKYLSNTRNPSGMPTKLVYGQFFLLTVTVLFLILHLLKFQENSIQILSLNKNSGTTNLDMFSLQKVSFSSRINSNFYLRKHFILAISVETVIKYTIKQQFQHHQNTLATCSWIRVQVHLHVNFGHRTQTMSRIHQEIVKNKKATVFQCNTGFLHRNSSKLYYLFLVW